MSDIKAELFINGKVRQPPGTTQRCLLLTILQYRKSSSGETLSIYNPNDDSLVTDQVHVASEKDVNDAVAAAKAAFPKWSRMAGHRRAAIMLKFADLLEKNIDKLAKLESVAMGQPISMAKGMIRGPAALWRCGTACAN